MITPAPEVDKPTYEIVGTVERFDQRDHPIARDLYMPGTLEYEDYYTGHPELKEWDDENRRLRLKSEKRKSEEDPVNSQLRPSVFYGKYLLGLPHAVEGKWDSVRQEDRKSWKKVDVDTEEMTRKVKAFARYLGATKVRITKLKQEWVYTHFAHPYNTQYTYGQPVELDYEYVICMAFRQNMRMVKCGTGIAVGLETGWKYSNTSLVSVILAQFLRSLGWRTRALPPENSPILIVPTYVDAGMGEQGRTCHVVTKEFGNNYRPGTVATDIPLVVDKPVDFGLQDFCEKCHICADYCPSGAITHGGKKVIRGVRRWPLEGDKCRRYWDSIGTSCSICQAVCPWSHDSNLLHDTIREVAQRVRLARKSLIKGEKLLYPYRRAPQLDWTKFRATSNA